MLQSRYIIRVVGDVCQVFDRLAQNIVYTTVDYVDACEVREILRNDSKKDFTLRRCPHPCKFEGGLVLDGYVYEVSLLGCDEEVGDVNNGNWYGLMRHGFTISADNDLFCEPITDDERAFLSSRAGVIIHEDLRGLVYVNYYAEEEDLNRDWYHIVEASDGLDPDGGTR